MDMPPKGREPSPNDIYRKENSAHSKPTSARPGASRERVPLCLDTAEKQQDSTPFFAPRNLENKRLTVIGPIR